MLQSRLPGTCEFYYSDQKRDAWVKSREVVPVRSGAQSLRRANAEIAAQPQRLNERNGRPPGRPPCAFSISGTTQGRKKVSKHYSLRLKTQGLTDPRSTSAVEPLRLVHCQTTDMPYGQSLPPFVDDGTTCHRRRHFLARSSSNFIAGRRAKPSSRNRGLRGCHALRQTERRPIPRPVNTKHPTHPIVRT
jgi:hypothetical protein